MKRFTQFGRIALAILLVLGMSGCPDKVPESGGNSGGSADPALVLKSLTVFGKDAMSFNIEVENEKTEVKPGDVVAKFDYGTEKDKTLTVAVANGTLNEGANTVTLSVKAVTGSYKAWSKNITVTRKAGGSSDDPALTLKSLTVFGKDAMSGSIEVENEKTEVKPEDVAATFDYGTEKDKALTVAVANGTLNVGANTVTLTVEAVTGSYKAWSKNITVTRIAAGTPGGTPAVNAVTMVSINLPASGQIVGAAPEAGTLPKEEDRWKGVFIEGRTVKLSAFEMAETETTYKLWKEVYDWAITHGYTFAHAGKNGEAGVGDKDQPVTMVNWRDAIVWCNAYTEMTEGKPDNCVYRKADGAAVLRNAAETYKSNKYECDRAVFDKTRKGFRLPTEAEWEYAARANADGTLNPLNYLSGASAAYTDAEACKAVAWYSGNSYSTYPVKRKKENGQNLYDMSGNVWEWCWDWRNDIVTAGDGGVNPVTDPAGPPSGSYRVDRGGSWTRPADLCLPGYRDICTPDYAHRTVGFRLCRSGS